MTDINQIYYVIISEDMVWLFVYNQHGDRGVKELLGRDATSFIEKVKANADNKLTDSEPVTATAHILHRRHNT